ncbi:GNAT family N-acetyltransferase [Microlunatus soli]|uniref:Predicted acetyltransferase, GNAT superfamily n=1 Tax=Microlunatus soli TaxID=630515 RepID=A0A1H1RJ89_9ACTN|nr:GNAT family N-acetyltransferase [Microlunatus soli]SDS35029.1 Predicted acetyltransferase, GNAT superfamily [Microlunatus soli]
MSRPFRDGSTAAPMITGRPADLADGVRAAQRTAGLAAQRSGVRISLLRSKSEAAALVGLLARIWGVPDDHAPVDPSIVAAMMHGQGYVSGAYAGSELVAGSIGFVTGDGLDTLHSHVTGVLGGRAGAGVGTAIKHHQRAWAVEHGLTSITWTFDPLIARNARFNLHRLGARLEEYLVDFYGPMNDDRNRGQPSDRAFTRWDLDDAGTPPTSSAACGRTDASTVLDIVRGGPTIDDRALATALRHDVGLVELIIPADIEAVRSRAPELAMSWRIALRDTLRPLLAAGWRVAAFLASSRTDAVDPDNDVGCYRLIRTTSTDNDSTTTADKD